MKKILLAGTALVGAAFIASPAQAQLKLDLGGHFSGYGVYVNEDNDTNYNNFEFRRNTEIHFTGETTLDNGLTVGFHTEMRLDGNDGNWSHADSNAPSVNETYAYFSGGWGRVNFGVEDGAAYLLQVAAPSADSNVDGLRPVIQGFQQDMPGGVLSYAHADFGTGPEDSYIYNYDYYTYEETDRVNRLTYLTPKFNGFQAGVSYAPKAKSSVGVQDMYNGDNYFENLWELAARWDGEFQGVGISVGAGYSNASDDGWGEDYKTWNAGATVVWNQFSLGGAYKHTNNAYTGNFDSQTWVVGAAWDNGPWHAGVSYLDKTDENWYGAGLDSESDRLTVGGGYSFGPGMSFRGSISWGQASIDSGVGTENEFTQVAIGTDIRF